jgi:hypothetical protein
MRWLRGHTRSACLSTQICYEAAVECFRIADYDGEQGLAITVSLSGFPGIVFQHSNGQSANAPALGAFLNNLHRTTGNLQLDIDTIGSNLIVR